MTTRKLFVPLDGSKLAELALPWAVCLARSRGFSIALGQVIRWPTVLFDGTIGTYGYVDPDLYDQMLADERDAANSYLRETQQRLVDQGIAVETAVREGETVESLLDIADELGAHLVVMATHGRGGLTRAVLGSVAERVLQHAAVPILLVPAQAASSAPAAIRRVLIPLDGSALAERATDVAEEIASSETAFTLVRVAPLVKRTIQGDAIVTIVDEDASKGVAAAAQGYLEQVANRLGQTGRHADARLRIGSATDGEEIVEAAREVAADLIVMATHGHTGPARWFLGSVADGVVRHADRPILLVSARAVTARVVGPVTVGDVMTRDLATVREDESLAVALRKLLRRRISGAPVVNADGELVGIISEHDLLTWQERLVDALNKAHDLSPADYARRLEADTVGQIMTRPAVTVDPSAPLSAAVHMFRERRLHRLPVVGEGQLLGIVTQSDVLRAMATRAQATPGDTLVSAGDEDQRSDAQDLESKSD